MDDKNIRSWRIGVGGLWEEIGKLQYNFLIKKGLKPEHFLLDVGCGSLRGGIYFIKYLKEGHYFGIDKNPEFLEGAKIELDENNLANKNPKLRVMENFDFYTLRQNFDYAIAQSVFTHLDAEKIKTCLKSIEKVIVQGGKFYATFFESPENNEGSLIHDVLDGKITTFAKKDPFHYPFSFFEKLCQGTKFAVDYFGEWNHPRNQKIMVFTKI